MPNEKDAEIKSRYEDYSVKELQAALDSIFDSTDEFSDSDVEQMDEIMAVLDKKDPLSQRYTAEESWKHFQENYREELSRLGVRTTGEVMEEEGEKTVDDDSAGVVSVINVSQVDPSPSKSKAKHGKCCRKLLHIALIAAAVVAAMVIITVSAAAAGIDIWKWVQVRGEGTVRFVAEDALSKDIPAALKQAGIEEPLFPTWIPEGFLLYEQQIRLDEPIHINSTYVCKDKTLSIIIRSLSDDLKSGMIENEENSLHEYLTHGVNHFIIPNFEQLVSYWMNGGFLVTISGNVSTDEMKHIINSVYDEVLK